MKIIKKMKYLLLLSLLFSAHSFAEYDEALAKSVGADDYGMKPYVMVILVTGDKVVEDKTKRNEAFAGHFANMSQLAEEKKLVVAGPLGDAEPKRGVFIFNTDNLESAESWVKTDPAVEAGLLSYELYKMYSSAALMLVNEQHKKLQKKPI